MKLYLFTLLLLIILLTSTVQCKRKGTRNRGSSRSHHSSSSSSLPSRRHRGNMNGDEDGDGDGQFLSQLRNMRLSHFNNVNRRLNKKNPLRGMDRRKRDYNLTETGRFSLSVRVKEGLGNFYYLALACGLYMIVWIGYKVYKGYRRQYFKSKLATLPYSCYQDRKYYEMCLAQLQ